MASPMMVYLFAGDSLTEGKPGASYVERVAKTLYQGWGGLFGEAINAGKGADTVVSLLSRIDEPLQRYRPQWVILAVGVNDVWIPWIAQRSFVWWVWSHYRRLQDGQKATKDLDQFAACYRALIDTVQRAGARVMVCTTSIVGERIDSPVNQRLARLNGVIKHVAVDRQVPVADVWQAFVEELAPLPKASRYTPGEWLFTWWDRRRLRDISPDDLSRRRHLHLTYDGLHLNSRGADLWAYTIIRALARVQGKIAAPNAAPNLLSAPSQPDEAA